MTKINYSKQKLLRILWVQEIDLFFTGLGFTRQAIFDKIIFKTFFIDRKTYSNYLGVNAKKELKERYGIDWKTQKDNYRPVNFLQIMDDFKRTGQLSVDTLKFLSNKHKL